jgi:hypothetical protein
LTIQTARDILLFVRLLALLPKIMDFNWFNGGFIMKKRNFIAVFALFLGIGSLSADETITVASGNVMYQDYYMRGTQGYTKNRMPLKTRTEKFENFLCDELLAGKDIGGLGVDIAFFYEWPNPNQFEKTDGIQNHYKQSKDWNEILQDLEENSGFKVAYSTRLFGTHDTNKKPVKDGIAVVVNEKNKKFKEIKFYRLPDTKPLGTYRGDALGVVVTLQNGKKVCVIGCHLQGGNPTDDYHKFRQDQIKKAMKFKKLIDETEKNSICSWIICGDFNWHCEDFYKYREHVDKVFKLDLCSAKNSWWNVCSEANYAISSIEYIHRSKPKMVTTHRIDEFRYNWLDYMFYRGNDINCKDSFFSDHQFVVSKFEIKD